MTSWLSHSRDTLTGRKNKYNITIKYTYMTIKKWNVGTDCSGIEAPIQALKQLKIPHNHVFSSDIDENVIKSINANYNPTHIYNDITKRELTDDPINLYVCGFPCQTFSTAGTRKGTKDKRGQIFNHCLKVIKTKTPEIFILENVKGLLTINGGKTFKQIIKKLENIKKYKVVWKVLNTKDYGIPQNRERIFIIGIRNDYFSSVLKNKFEWPKKKIMKSLKSFVDKNDKSRQDVPKSMVATVKQLPKDSQFINMNFKNKYQTTNLYSPTLMAVNLLWCVPMSRYANVKECLALQGFPKNFKQVVSNTQMKKQIGNSMSVNVLKELYKVLQL